MMPHLLLHALFLLLLARVSLSQPLTLPPLPYAYDALEPVISESTLRSHHLAHHQTYTDKANAVLTELRAEPNTKHLSKRGLDYLVRHIHNLSLPLSAPQRTALRNHGGGYLNHVHYFDSLTPPLSGGGGNLSIDALPALLPSAGSRVAALIDQSFGSFDAFQQAFTLAALAVFGSGWSWLTSAPALHSLSVQSTQQQDSPWMEERFVEDGGGVLLGIDCWEHSYYLDRQSNRAEYVRGWWKLINWERVEQRLDEHRTTNSGKTHRELR